MYTKKQSSVKLVAVLIVVQMALMLFFAVPTMAEDTGEEDGIQIDAKAETGIVTISGTDEALGGQEASLMIFAPEFSGEPVVTDENLAAIDQFTVEEDGSFEISVRIKQPVKGDYHLYINGTYLYKTFSFFTDDDEYYILGDVTGDELVKIDDALLVQKYVAKIVAFEPIQKLAADTYQEDAKGLINLKDVLTIQKYVAGKDVGKSEVGEKFYLIEEGGN